ncbi:MAG: glycosyltransferase [Pseudomonadota bacterium]
MALRMMTAKKPRLSYYCHSLGTPDHERCNALAEDYDVIAYDWARDNGYIWKIPGARNYTYRKIDASSGLKKLLGAGKLLVGTISDRATASIFYGYHNIFFFFSATIAKLLMRTSITMLDSKFDDYDRTIIPDLPKKVLLTPYDANLVASERAAAYAKYLSSAPKFTYYCAIDTYRVSEISREHYRAIAFEDRQFVMVARFVPKKNHKLALKAYERYLTASKAPHKLTLYGYGPLEEELKEMIATSELLSRHVTVSGFVPSAEIPRVMGQSLALILPSTEEQFGIVTTEALSASVPVIISKQCGSADLVVSGENGYVMNTYDESELANYMLLVSEDEAHWNRLSSRAPEKARNADVQVFRALVNNIVKYG